MTEKKTDTAETPTEVLPGSRLATALAAFQEALPTVSKGTAGQVRGNPNYKYADLADLNGTVLPKLGEYGLSFSCKPTVNEHGRFVLAYVLRHASGESDAGEYPLPDDVSPQDMGSAQTYARRYVLQAMTGVAPDGQDDDGAAATRAYSHRGQGKQQTGNGRQQPAQSQDEPTVAGARAELAAACEANGWDRDIVAGKYADKAGHALGDATDPGLIEKFRAHLFNLPQAELQPAAKEAAA